MKNSGHTMTPPQPLNVDAIYLAALERPEGSERAAYLDRVCAAKPELRQRVERLLRAQPHVESFLESAAAALGALAPTAAEPPLQETPGAQIGPYKLLEQIGEGGFGIVFMAEQQHPVRRKVALKVLKPGMDTRQVIARFEAERQALALMDHPHIAKVFDAGAAESGRPYFVMELVRGVPITEFCDANRLTPRERLELFVSVCQAVQHAHQKGIIHRDIKPSNVLVTSHDGVPVVKVIDFGVAKALGQQLTDKTVFTAFAQMIGTPMYMSPEQAELSGLDIDTRTDVYSLGVLLYELLTGTTPFDKDRLRTAAFDEIRRIIREEEPQKPSTRLSSLSRSGLTNRTSDKREVATSTAPVQQPGAASLASIAALRKMEPRRLSQLVRGDLDWIVMKALEKDRNRRYETGSGFALDIQRYLADEPVSACPPSAAYRFQKFARRNKLFLTSVAAIMGILLAATAIVAWKWQEAEHARTQEQSAKVHAVEARDEAKAAEKRALSDQQRAVRAEQEARLREADALAGQAHGIRLSRRPGQRFDALEALGKAATIGRELDQPAEWFDRLRNEAIAALALPDVHITKTWAGFPPGSISVDLNDNLEWYARTDERGACSIRRTADDRELARLPELGELANLTFGGGSVLAVHGSDSKRLQVWDLSDADKPILLIKQDDVEHLAFRSDGRHLGTASKDGSVSIYDVVRGFRFYQLTPGEIVPGIHVALHPTEPLVAIFSYVVPRLVQVRDLRSGAVVASALCPWPGGTGHACWRPDGRALAVPSGDGGKIQQYAFEPDKPNLQPVNTIDGPDVGCATIVYSPAGDRFISGGWSQTLQLFDEISGRLLFSTPAAQKGSLRFDRTGRWFASARGVGQNDRIGLYSVADGREYRSLVRQGGTHASSPVLGTAIHPGGRLAALGHPSGGDGDLARGMALFDLESGRSLARIRFPTISSAVVAAFDGNGNLLTNNFDGLFRWPVRSDPARPGRLTIGPPEKLPFQPGDCSIATSRNGQVIAQCMWATAAMPGGGWILHPNSAAPRCVEPGSCNAFCNVSPDGRWVAFTHVLLHTINVYETETGRCVWQSPANCGWWCHFSQDSRWLATDIDGGRLYDVDTWQAGPQLGPGQPLDVTADLAVLGMQNGFYRLVALPGGRELARLEDPELNSGPAAFTPDGTKLVVAARDGARVWDLRAIRRELLKLGLDWDAPAYPPDMETSGEPRLEVVVDLGSLAPEKPLQPGAEND